MIAENKLLSIIFVNYNTSQLLSDCLDSIICYEKNWQDYEYIVVDNNSGDKGLDSLKKTHPFIRLIIASRNGGFAYGNNIGIQNAEGKMLFLLNPDTYIKDNAIEKLVNRINTTNDLFFIGPQLLYPDNSNQSFYLPKTYLTLWRFFCDRIFLHRLFPKSTLFNSYYQTYMDYDQECLIEQISGAAFMFKREVIEKIGLLDENYFMYFEESDYCLKAINYGYKLLYYPESKIIHIGGLGNSKNWDRSTLIFSESLKYYFIKNYGCLYLIFAIMLQATGSLIRMVVFFLIGEKKFKYHFYFLKNIFFTDKK